MHVSRHDLTDPFTQLGRLRELASRSTGSGRFHPGELTWARFQHIGREPEWPTAWWEAAGRTLAWAWLELPGELNLHVDRRHPELLGEVLDWCRSRVRGSDLRVTVFDSETHLVDGLVGAGFVRDSEEVFFVHMVRDLGTLGTPRLPDGFGLRSVTGPDDAAARAAVHASAFSLPGLPPSRVTADSYRVVMGQPPYRSELDWIAETADGEPVAFCLAWLDEDRGAEEDGSDVVALEPVGCAPGYRRLGLANAVVRSALLAARDLGARTARVTARGDGGHPSARALYDSMGFVDVARTRTYVKAVRSGRGRHSPVGSRTAGGHRPEAANRATG